MKTKKLILTIFVILTGIFSSVSYVKAVECTGINTPPGCTQVNTKYQLLAPLPDGAGGLQKEFNVEDESALGNYINIIITLTIGISAVLAVVMIVMGGIQYMGNELISSKEEGSQRIWNAILGLLIALGAYALLNTINPDLLKSDIKIPVAEVTIENFPVSGAQTKDGKPGKPVSLKTEACPAAQSAQSATGVDKALVLAIFAQETASGANTGGCKPANANMYPVDITALATIVGASNVANTNVSCASGGGRGGAIGLMQFRPTTWLETRDNANRDPWKTDDALTVAALLLKKGGGVTDPRNAACRYYSGDACQPGRNPPNEFYGNEVMNKMASISKQIAEGACGNTGGASGSW